MSCTGSVTGFDRGGYKVNHYYDMICVGTPEPRSPPEISLRRRPTKCPERACAWEVTKMHRPSSMVYSWPCGTVGFPRRYHHKHILIYGPRTTTAPPPFTAIIGHQVPLCRHCLERETGISISVTIVMGSKVYGIFFCLSDNFGPLSVWLLSAPIWREIERRAYRL